MTDFAWQEDILGEGFQKLELDLSSAAGPDRVATLIRYLPATGPATEHPARRHALLFLHGWSDYFFNTELARFWSSLGVAFYALDMHNHGRSLRQGDLGGFVASLSHYDGEIEAALDIVEQDLRGQFPGEEPSVSMMGHSTGGLVASLWADRNPGRIRALILNSPWLEMHGSSLMRLAASSVLDPLARLRPETRIRLPELGFYWRSISKLADGEWDLDLQWRPRYAFPVRAGWLRAVLEGHAKVAKGLDIGVPILVLMSARTLFASSWREEMKQADVVLDVQTMAVRALNLGSSVTIERVEGGLHDVFLSELSVRRRAYTKLRRWVRCYLLAEEGDEGGEGP